MLSNSEILENIQEGGIVIHPFDPRNLGTNSYDVTLGEFYYREQRVSCIKNVYDIYDEKEVNEVWGFPFKASGYYLKPGNQYIMVEPGETILAHTNEFIGGRYNISTMMKARSSFGRNFIEVCKCAGLGDVGYINRWTMEITNNSRFYSIPLITGRRIAQIVFFKTGSTVGDDYSTSGKYQNTPDLATLEATWRPEMMLPRLYLDREVVEGGE